MRIAIVILNWNGVEMLRQYLPVVIEQSRNDADIIIADNASTDESVAFLHSNYPDIRIIQLDKNYGFAGGYNRALQQVDAEYYLLLNSDVKPAAHWLEPLAAFMDANKDAAACQPKILSIADPTSFEYAGACGGFIDRYGYPFCRGRIFNSVERDEGQYDDIIEVVWASGACLFIRSVDYWSCGGFDERFFAHNEEIDLCWRLHLMGRKIYCVPQSKVWHVGGGTLPKGNPMKTFLNFRNNLTMLYKNLNDSDLKRVMRMRTVLDYIAAAKMLLLDRNAAECKAVFKARRAFRRWLPDFAATRSEIEQKRVPTATDCRSRYSILWQYYVRHRHTYKTLPKD